MFKWLCLLVAAAALVAFGWMLNDMRLQVKALADNADSQLLQLKGLMDKADKVLSQSEQAAVQVDRHLPRILSETERATTTVNEHLPTLLAHSEAAVDSIADLADGFQQYKGLMGFVHGATQNKGLFSYASGILDLIEGQPATIGKRKAGTDQKLKQAQPAKAWASATRKDAHFVSLGATSKAEVLHGLAKTSSSTAWHIQFPGQVPLLLTDWLKDTHPESKDVK